MNSRFVNIILLASFCIVVFVYYQKSTRTSDHVDYVEQSLSGLKKILAPTARIKYQGISSDFRNNRENYLICRYALAPVVLGTKVQSDSVFMIYRNDADSSYKYVTAGTQIIWENKDSAYHYLLIKQQQQ